MIQNDDGTVSLEEGDRINMTREINWIVHDWMDNDKYDGALVFGASGRVPYMLWPYKQPVIPATG